MPDLDAESFARELHAEFEKKRVKGHKTKTVSEWTRHLFPMLAEIARRKNLWWAGRGYGEGKGELRDGEAREYLWDFTMYHRIKGRRAAKTWNLPCVIIEHENSYNLPAFKFDHWKTLFSHAPLRVAIGYVRKRMASRREEWVEEINRSADRHAWHFPPQCEDLIALGYYGMTKADNFEFWRRGRSERRWTKLPVP